MQCSMYIIKSNHFISGNEAHRSETDEQISRQTETDRNTETHKKHKRAYLLIIQKCLTSSLGQLRQDRLNAKEQL